MTEIYPDPENLGYEDDVPIEAPDVVPPSAGTPGNIPAFVLPETEIAYHAYELDIADTALVWQPGSPIDTGLVRQYLVDRSYTVTSVDVQIGDDGLPTGILTVRTNPVGTPVYPPVEVTIEDDTESSTTAISIAQDKIADIAIPTLPANATFSGEIVFDVALRRDVATGTMGIVPVVNGAAQPYTSIAGDTVDSPVTVTIPVSGWAGGTAPTVGLKYRGGTTAGTTTISNASITVRVVDGVTTPATPITPAHWAAYDGSRYQGIVETVVTWTDTAEGAITPKPDLDRLISLQMHIENHGYEVQQITGGWNFTTPDTAPVSPDLHVFARGAVDPAVTDTFLYSEIQQADRDAFQSNWNAASSESKVQRKVQGKIETPGQSDRSAPVLFPYTGPGDEPTGDVREGDYWQSAANEWRKYINGEWVLFATGSFSALYNTTSTGRRASTTDANTTATGAFAEAPNSGSTATGAVAKATGSFSTATGSNSNAKSSWSIAHGRGAIVETGSSRSIAEGFGATVPINTPDTKVTKINNVIQERSDGTGATTYTLKSPDGTAGVIAVTDTDGLTVNGNAVGGTSFTASDTPSIDLTLSGGTLSAAAIFGTTAGTVAQGNHTHAQLHDPLTVTDGTTLDFTLTGQDLTGEVKDTSIVPAKLDRPYQAIIPFASGKYYSTAESAYGMRGDYTATAMVANRIYYLPFYVPHPCTFDQIGINVQTAVASSNARLGIFTFNTALDTATLVLDAGAVSTAATGSVFAAVSITLQAGWYWLAINCSHTPSLRSFTPADGFACNSVGTIIGARLKASDPYGAYSATETADNDHATGYLVLMRAA